MLYDVYNSCKLAFNKIFWQCVIGNLKIYKNISNGFGYLIDTLVI
jgi:hypothetical protein